MLRPSKVKEIANDKFIPAVLAQHTVESLYAEHGRQRPWIYWSILLFCLGGFAALPLVKVDFGMICNPHTQGVEVIACYADRQEFLATKNTSNPYRNIIKKYSDKLLSINELNDNQNKYIIFSFGPSISSQTYVAYDIKNDKEIMIFPNQIPVEINTQNTEPISFVARDGLRIRGYLTVPAEMPVKGCPLVVQVHGGPWIRDTAECDPIAEFLLQCGFSVLRINYRGSSGFGEKFLNAGNYQWGKAMIDDIADGVHWVVKNKGIDINRIAIIGFSYGGYAAIMSLVRHPQIYQCAISLNPLLDVSTFYETAPEFWGITKDVLLRRVGDPVKDKDALKQISPNYNVARIIKPLLLFQGGNDILMNKKIYEEFIDEIKQVNKDFVSVFYPNEGHEFANQDTINDMGEKVYHFLARYLQKNNQLFFIWWLAL
jgi:dipeptidyl aminopeptidase/acylaminoacyl peptidase